MRRVIIESPYAGNVERNIAYARLCVKNSLLRDEAPLASHLLYTQDSILDDLKSEERALGINAGHAWITCAEEVIFYVDFGMSRGMQQAYGLALAQRIPIKQRFLVPAVVEELKQKFGD